MSLEAIRQDFSARFGSAPEAIAFAPGRVNLIGEHTDYHEGFVFPAAIELGVWIAARRTKTVTRMQSSTLEGQAMFDVHTIEPSDDALGWGNFCAGMAWAMRMADVPIENLEVLIHSTVPIGGGVSSSAAVEMGLGVLWSHFAGTSLDPKELAKLGKRAENEFVGKQSGIMDQMASANGRTDQAMFLDTRSLEIRYAGLPAGVQMVICDTCVSHAGDDGSYNWAREGSMLAASRLGVRVLRDITLEELEARRGELDEREYRSAHHVVSENARALAFADALDRADLGTLGQMMSASHHSLRYDYRVSCDELDIMAEEARRFPGTIGARMTGGGFGGACIALVTSETVADFVTQVSGEYVRRTGVHARLIPTSAVKGAHLVEALPV